jgi:uncharacterized membrane protein YcaP (DUF421 family)
VLDLGLALMEVVVRAVVVYLILWMLLRIMGKRELTEMTAFELVLTSVVSRKLPRTRPLLEDVPVVVIRDGQRRQG